MNIFKIAFVGALIVGSSSAYADYSRAPGLNAPVNQTVSFERLAMRRSIESSAQNVAPTPQSGAKLSLNIPASTGDEPIEHATSFDD